MEMAGTAANEDYAGNKPEDERDVQCAAGDSTGRWNTREPIICLHAEGYVRTSHTGNISFYYNVLSR